MTDSKRYENDLDLNSLLHPAQAFNSPAEVVNDPDLTVTEKRAILSSWASDACAVEAMPEIRSHPSGSTAQFNEIIAALRELDRQRPDKATKRAIKETRRRAIFRPRSGGSPPRGRAA